MNMNDKFISTQSSSFIAVQLSMWSHPFTRQSTHTDRTVLQTGNGTDIVCGLQFTGVGPDLKWIGNKRAASRSRAIQCFRIHYTTIHQCLISTTELMTTCIPNS